MPVISKIRFTNVIYENGNKRYQDEVFHFDGNNSTIVLENGGGKTVWVQTALQAILPHTEVGTRRAYETFLLSEGPAHIAIEWIINQKPRRNLVTAVSLYEQSQRLQSYRYVYEYGLEDDNSIENIPYVKNVGRGLKRPADRLEIQEYYSKMSKNNLNAKTFSTIEKYYEYLSQYHIIESEWKKIAEINGAEGDVAKFFEKCQTTTALVERLLIPIVEDGISGQGTKNFVEAFENQREHIKKYRQLKEQISECTLILQKVKGFTEKFSLWDKENKNLNNLKSKAKAIYGFTKKEYEKETIAYEDHISQEEDAQRELENLEYKKASYNLSLLQKDGEEKRRVYQNALEEFETIKDKLKKLNHRLNSLQYAQIRQNIEDNIKEEKDIIDAIKRLSMDNAAAEIQESLEENSRYLCGYYQNALEEIEKQLNQFITEKERGLDDLKENESKKKLFENEKTSLEERKTSLETKEAMIQKDMEDLKKKILDRPEFETIEAKKQLFNKRLEIIEEEIYDGYNQLEALKKEEAKLSEDKVLIREKLDDLNNKISINQNNLDNLEENSNKIIGKLRQESVKWSHIESLYNSPLIVSTIETQIEQSYRDLNNAMDEERISRRWLDDYEKGDYFLADPRILNRLNDWKKEFALLLTGSEYIKGLEDKNNATSFPYWAMTLITTDKEIHKLKEYINDNKNYMSHPIWVMSDHEAGQYLQGKAPSDKDLIFPSLWENNIHTPSFIAWKESLNEKAKIAKEKREEIQYNYQKWNDLKREIIDFYNLYPLELFQELRTNKHKYNELKAQKEKTLAQKENREKEIRLKQNHISQKENQLEGEKINIASKMDYIFSYEKKDKDVETFKNELNELIYPRLKEIIPEIKTIDKEISYIKDRQIELGEDIFEKNHERNQILDDIIYKEVKNHLPLYSSYSKEMLQSQRDNLKRELDKEQKGRRDLEDSLIKIRTSKAKLEEGLENQLSDNPDLDKTIRFIKEHQAEIKNIIKNRRSLKPLESKLENKKEGAKTSYDSWSGLYKDRKQKFDKTYPALYTWQVPFNVVKENLKKEEKDLNDKMIYIKGQIKKVQDQQEKTKTALDTLKLKNERFGYLDESIILKDLTEDESLTILYQKEKHVNELIRSLEDAEKILKEKKEDLSNKEQGFIEFCKGNIKDIRLREITLKGIENLKSYEDVIYWENNLNNRIMRTQTIAEDDIKSHQEELELFIEVIHTHVKQVADDLGEIHKKTRVKIGDQWKNVYTITVPQWEHLKGKEEIQNYILWIIGQLESGKYPEENHRREIEKWLSVKQLLGVVTQKQAVTVKCRKITNQNTLAPISSTWESSNKWSGGERWSKNMVLFLGLLNFLAEKTGHVIEGQKPSKAVILDNPFGQASSDHVLDPVFFVAQQLGFQIITLTALAEGSFIRKYFPVVYSCRLRPASDGSQVMAKELQIQRALFKDEKLPSLARLENQGQLSLLAP